MSGRAFEVRPDEQALDRIFAPYDRADAPGLVVGLALEGTPLYCRGFGLAAIGLPQRLAPGMRLRIGSVSKHFLCLLLLLLQEEGKLSLGDSPRRFIPELPSWAEDVTLRQLMSHTSGMRCSLDLILQSGGLGRPLSEQAQLQLLCRQTGLNFTPGTAWCYSNGGYVLLGCVAERAAGMPLGELLQGRLFAPAGMRDTLLWPDDADDLPNAGVSHLPSPRGGYERCVFGPSIGGEGGIVSTVDDMLRWMAQMMAPTFADAASWRALYTPLSANGYGLGLYSGHYRGARIVHHSGNVIGGTCQMLRLPDCGLDVILIGNRGDVDCSALALQVVDTCVAGLHDRPRGDEAAACLSGDFHSAASGAFVRLLPQEGRQYGMFPVAMVPLRWTSGMWVLDQIASDLRLAPVPGPAGVAAVEIYECGRRQRLQRLPAAASTRIERPLRGVYHCSSLDAAATVADHDGQALLTMRSPYGTICYLLEVLGPRLCLASTGNPRLPLGGLIEFDDWGFRFSSQRTWRLQFSRVGSTAS